MDRAELDRRLAELGLSLPPDERERVLGGIRADLALAARLRDWLAARGPR